MLFNPGGSWHVVALTLLSAGGCKCLYSRDDVYVVPGIGLRLAISNASEARSLTVKRECKSVLNMKKIGKHVQVVWQIFDTKAVLS